MGIPLWSPQKQQHQHEHELLKRRLPSRQLLLQAALINQQPRHHRSRPHQLRRSTAAESNDGYTAMHSLLPQSQDAQSLETQLAADRQMELRFSEKKELLDQLKITTSLLDQFLSMGDLSTQDSALPPFITNDLVAILTATSASLTTSNPSSSTSSSSSPSSPPPPPPSTTNPTPSASSSPTTSSSLPTPSSLPTSSSSPTSSASSLPFTAASTLTASLIHGSRPIDYRSLRSNLHNNNDTRLTGLVDAMIRSPPHAARWADLESDIASIHQRVIDQLILLGAGLSHPTVPFSSTTSLPTPIQHS